MKNSFWKLSLAAAGFAVAVFVSPASAQRPDDMKGGGGNPCVGDAQKICNEFIPDRAKVASCLFKNKKILTPACRRQLGGGGGEKKAGKHRKGGKRHGRRHRRR